MIDWWQLSFYQLELGPDILTIATEESESLDPLLHLIGGLLPILGIV